MKEGLYTITKLFVTPTHSIHFLRFSTKKQSYYKNKNRVETFNASTLFLCFILEVNSYANMCFCLFHRIATSNDIRTTTKEIKIPITTAIKNIARQFMRQRTRTAAIELTIYFAQEPKQIIRLIVNKF